VTINGDEITVTGAFNGISSRIHVTHIHHPHLVTLFSALAKYA
jgi:hypothetical protein